MKRKRVFIVAPVFNEKGNIVELLDRIEEAVAPLQHEFPVLLVNDGSDEETTDLLDEMSRTRPRVGVLHLSRNFGHQAGLSAGMQEAMSCGADAVITMDSDLQHPPRMIPELVRLWECGHDVVYTIRNDEVRTGPLKRMTASLFYWCLDLVSERPVPRGAADFRLLDRAPLVALTTLPERTRFLRGLTTWIGYRQVGIHYVPDARFSGTTKFDLKRMVNLAGDGLVSMTTLPLRVVILLGLGVSLVSLVYLVYIIFAHTFTNRTLPGWSSVMVSVLLLGGMTLTVLGVIGLYLAKIFEEVKGRPLYLVRRRSGSLDPDAGPGEGRP